MDARKTREKNFWTHETPTRKNLEPTNLNTRNTHEKKFRTHETSIKKIWTHEKPTRKYFGPTKTRWHYDTRTTRSMMARELRNLAHSGTSYQSILQHTLSQHTFLFFCCFCFCCCLWMLLATFSISQVVVNRSCRAFGDLMRINFLRSFFP